MNVHFRLAFVPDLTCPSWGCDRTVSTSPGVRRRAPGSKPGAALSRSFGSRLLFAIYAWRPVPGLPPGETRAQAAPDADRPSESEVGDPPTVLALACVVSLAGWAMDRRRVKRRHGVVSCTPSMFDGSAAPE